MDGHGQRSGQGIVRRLAVLLGSAALLLPLAEPVGQRTGFVARTLLAMAATAVATPAQAQTVETLVSNLEQADGGPGSFGFQHAQAFTTGGDAYTVTSVEIQIVDITGGENLSVEIWSESGGLPEAVLSGGALVMPDTLAAGVNEFTASGTGIALSANTTYFVVIKPAVSDSVSGNLRNTTSDSEDAGGKTGWSIANNSRFRGNFDTDSWSSFGESKKIRLKGQATTTTPNTAPTVANQIPDQTATVGTAFSFTFPDTTFADTDTDDTLTYTAMLSDDSALPGWLSFDPDSRTFSGTPTTAGTITVRVTASDGTDSIHDDFDIEVLADTTAPMVVSISRFDPAASPTAADSLTWDLFFSEEVQNVDAADFTVEGTDAMPTVEVTSNPLIYAVTVSGGNLATLTATVTLGFADDQDIADLAGNALESTATNTGSTDERTYDLDNTAPTVVSIERRTPAASPTNADSLTWRVTFDESVRNVNAGDFQVDGTSATVSVVEVQGTDDKAYDVTATGGDLATLNTTVTLGFVSGQNITDELDNPLTDTATTGATDERAYDLDNTAPTVVSIKRQAPSTENTSEGVLNWTVTFSELVENVDKTDFAVTGTTATVTNVFDHFDNDWIVSVRGGDLVTFSGPVGLGFAAAQNIADAAGNRLTATTPTSADESFTVDNTHPTVMITGVPANSAAPFTATITFSEAVSRFVQDDITATNATLSAFTEVTTAETPPGTVWTVLVTPTATGVVTLNIPAHRVPDLVGNRNEEAEEASSTYTAPVVSPSCPAPDFGTREQIWTGTVTVGADTTPVVGPLFHGFDIIVGGLGGTIGALDDTEFTIGDRDYTIEEVYVSAASGDSGELSFGLLSDLTTAEKAALQLHVCATAYNFSAASGPGDNNTYFWNAGLDWSGESTRTLYLSLPANTPATGAPSLSSSGSVQEAMVGDVLTAALGDIADTDGLPGTFPDDYTVQWIREDGDGTNAEDISGETSSTYTLAAADMGKRVRVRMSFTDDLGRSETRTSNPFPAIGTVANITPPMVSISGPSSAVDEGNDLTFTFTLDKAAPTDVTVGVAISETEDMVAAADEGSRTVTIVTGDTQATLTVTTDDDDDDEANSEVTVTVVADDASPATYGVGSAAAVMVTVEDNDLPRLRLDGPSQTTYDEGETVRFGLTREGDLSSQLVVPVTVSGGENMIAGTPPSSVTLAVGTATLSILIPTVNDDVDEEDGEISVTVSADPALYRLVDATNNPVNQRTTSATVQDDDTRGVTVSGSPLVVNEGGTGAYGVELTSAPTGEVTITLSLASPGNEDVTFMPTTLTFTAINWDTPQTVTVTTTEDTDDVPDTATITHTVAGADYGANNVTAESVTVTVSEEVLPSVTIAADTSPVTEGTAAAFTLTRTGDDTTNALTVNVTVTENGEVISGSAPPSVTFEMGSSTATLRVATDDDEVDEDAGMVMVMVAGAVPATYVLGDSASASVTVDDNDATPMVMLSLSPITIAEAAGVSEIRATLSNPSAVETRVTVSLPAEVAGAVELDPDPPVLVIPAGMTDSSNVVTLTAVDNDADAPDLSVALSGVGSNTVGVTNPQSVTLTITDDDETIPMDTTAPRVAAIERQTPVASPTNADSLTWRVTFSEVVTNVDTADFTVSGSTATVTTVEPVSGEPLATDVTVSGGDLANFNGRVALGFASDQNIADEANNALASTTPTGANDNSYMLDNAAPMVTIMDVPETSTAPFTATITFNKVVSGFTVDDVTVVNAILSDFTETTTGTVWTVLVTPVADGRVTLEIGANVAEDAVGNGNTAALQARSTYNAPAMEIEAKKEEAEAVLSQVVLPEVVQQLTAETTEVITSRLNAIASGSSPSAPPTLSLEDVVADTVAAIYGQREHLENGSLDWRQALSGRNFALPLSNLNVAQGEGASAQDDHPFSTLAIWGGGNYSRYRNSIEHTDVDGNGFSGVIAMDLQPIPRLTTGLALTTSRWGLDYATTTNDARAEGTYEIGITMVNPYVNWLATEQLSLWATVGYGRGEVEQDPDGEEALSPRTDSLTNWAGGIRFEVVPAMDPRTGQGSPLGLAFKGDGATSSFLDTNVQLARLAAEVSRSFAVEGGLLSAALDLGWRIRSVSNKDGLDELEQRIADKNEGGGAELAGRLHWLSTDGSLSATVDTRVLLGGGHHRQWGIGGHLRLTPSRRDGEGLSLTLQPSFGITDTRLDQLWSLSGTSNLAINNDQPGARLDAELAYGFPLGNALLTPYTEWTWEEATNTYGAGLRYGLNPSLELNLKGTRRSNVDGSPEHRLLLHLRSDP